MKIHTLFLIILITAITADLFIPFVLAGKYPKYDHLRDTISTLGSNQSPVKKLQNINLIFVGALFLIFSFGQKIALSQLGWSHYLYICGIILFGVGCIIAGIYPEDPKGVEESVSGKIHGIASGIGFIFLILNPLWAFFIKDFEVFQKLNIILLIIGIIAFALFIVSENIETGTLQYTGFFQRINLFVLHACLLVNYSAKYTEYH